MDEMILKFSDIEAELNNKSKKNNWNLRYSLQPSNSISDYKRHSLQLKSKGNLAPNLESVEEYTSYALKSPADFDSFMINQETWEVEKTK
ncbi:11894_t:CDS:2 [Gigaspora rosea]|nr:11894_t:CDS:2 [Gigaspora rosea]